MGYVAAVAGLKDAAFAQFAKTCDHYAASCDLHNLTSVCVAPPTLRLSCGDQFRGAS